MIIKLEETDKFSFQCDSKELTSTIKKYINVDKLSSSPDHEKTRLLVSYNSNLYFIGHSSDTGMCMRIPTSRTKGNGVVNIDHNLILGLVKNRSVLNFTLVKGQLKFKAVKGNYSGSMETLAYDRTKAKSIIKSITPSKTTTNSIPKAVVNAIREGIKYVDIKDFYNPNKIICLVQSSKNKISLMSGDNYHMVHYAKHVDFDNKFRLAFSIDMFKALDDFIQDEDTVTTFHITDSSFKAFSDDFVINFPPVQTSQLSYTAIPKFISKLEEPRVSIPFNTSAISTVDNMIVLSTVDTKLTLDMLNNKLDISIATDRGELRDTFTFKNMECQNRVKVLIDPRLFDDLFSKIKDKEEVNLRMYRSFNAGRASSFLISTGDNETKIDMVGTYYESNE